jgi:hypothetical protein
VTTNSRPCTFPITPTLETILEQQADRERLQRFGVMTPYVFHRLDGRATRSFYRACKAACRAAGSPGRIPHEMGRSAVRNLVRAGVPERVAMSMTGHLTPSVFARYEIMSEADQAGTPLDEQIAGPLGSSRTGADNGDRATTRAVAALTSRRPTRSRPTGPGTARCGYCPKHE